MAKRLSPEFIASRTKSDRLETIKNINFWGNELEEISILRKMQNLEVVSLSVNNIKSLKDFGFLKNLKELYLRKNLISEVTELEYLIDCENLRILWLSENPITDIKNYRLITIQLLPQLNKLDDATISQEERRQAAMINLKNILIKKNKENNFNEYGINKDNLLDDPIEEFREKNKIDENYNYNNQENKNNYRGLSLPLIPNPRDIQNNCNNDYENNNNLNQENFVKNKKFYREKDKEIDLIDDAQYYTNNIPQQQINQNIYKYNKKPNNNLEKENFINKKLENLTIHEKEENDYYTERPKNNKRNFDEKLQYQENNRFSGKKQDVGNLIYNTNTTNGNILNCIVMLMKELEDQDLLSLKSEIEKRIKKN